MPLPEPVARRPIHHRRFYYDAFLRDDGNWDIEGRITDHKDMPHADLERGWLAPGEKIHDISARLTVDTAMTVLQAEAAMEAKPFMFCTQGAAGTERLIGTSLARGWRRSLEDNLGGTAGCTHLKELLLGMATVGYQTVAAEAERVVREIPGGTLHLVERPFYINGCHAFSETGPVVREFYPNLSAGKTPTET